MKTVLAKRIIILVSIAVIISSVLVSLLGIFLSEGLLSDIKSLNFIPDMNVLSECTIQYQNGSIDEETFVSILKGCEEQNNTDAYTVYNEKGELLYKSDRFSKGINDKLLNDALSGKRVFHLERDSYLYPSITAGIPIMKENKIKGAIIVQDKITEVASFRQRFIKSLCFALIIVVPFVIILSYIFLKRITKPIKNIGAVALAMVKGDFAIRADETMLGEVGLLGKTLNELSIELYRNISALFLEKERLSQVLNSLNEGMLAVDSNNIITHINPAFLEMFDIKDAIGNHILSFPSLKSLNNELSQAMEEKCTIVRNIKSNSLIMRMIVTPIRNNKDEIAGAVILFRDITELERLENMRRNYVSNVSHELRSPLTSIRGLIEPLMEGIISSEEDKSRYYNIIYQETMRLSRLIDDIMELSRLQTSDTFIEKRYFSLNNLMDIIYERYKIFDNIELVFDIPSLPDVYSNSDRIEQVMVILLDNAFKFTPKGGTITVSAKLEGNYVKVSVRDNGCGISSDDLPYIFERFYKCDKSRTEKGAGLGLSILKEILNAMGETVNVKSKPGEGTEFEFTIRIS